MTDLYKLITLLDNQRPESETGWPHHKYKVDRSKAKEIKLCIQEDKLLFIFDVKENFVGICNYKE